MWGFALKQLLHEGAEEYIIEKYSKEEISIRQVAELLNIDIYKLQEMLGWHDVKSSSSYKHFVKGIDKSTGL